MDESGSEDSLDSFDDEGAESGRHLESRARRFILEIDLDNEDEDQQHEQEDRARDSEPQQSGTNSGVEPQPSTSAGLRSDAHFATNIARFRPVIGENGETLYEFDSAATSTSVSSEDSDSSEDEDYIPYSVNRVVSTNGNEGTSQAQSSNRRSRLRNSSSASRSVQSLIDDLISESNTPETSLPAVPVSSRRNPSGRNRNRIRKRPARRPKKTEKKVSKTPRVTKPLTPKVVRNQVSEYTSAEKKLFDTLRSSSKYRCSLNFDGKQNEDDYLVGNLDVQIVEPELRALPSFTAETIDSVIGDIQKITLCVNEEGNKSLLSIELEEKLNESQCEEMKISSGLRGRELERKYFYINTKKLNFQINLCGTPLPVFGGLCAKALFRLDVVAYDESTKVLSLKAVMLKSGIYIQHSIEANRARKSSLIAEVVQHFFDVDKLETYSDEQTMMQGKEDIAWFYGQIKKYHRQEVLPFIPFKEQGDLIPILRDYQKDAVQWMLWRENGFINKVNLAKMFLDRMFVPILLAPSSSSEMNTEDDESLYTSKTVFYSPYLGTFAWNLPTLKGLPSGGILCDEMGLGKTVEVLSLVTLNQRKDLESENLQDQIDYGTPSSPTLPVGVKHEGEAVHSEPESEHKVNVVEGDTKKKRRSRPGTRKRRKWGGRRVKKVGRDATPEATTSKKSGEAQKRPFLSPTKTKRRNVSPCEFETKIPANGNDLNVPKHSEDTTTADTPNQTIKKKRKTNVKEPGEKVYDRLKVVYEGELSQYVESPVLSKRFKGEFFNPNIPRKICFECICGSGQEDKYVVTCAICSCSQHSECVGFDFKTPESLYTCPHCTTEQIPREIKATLIVTPPTIAYQWIQEIQKHIKNANLKILFYKGVSEQGYIPPSILAQYDIIITTYTILSTELNYVDIPHGDRRFRNAKRYVPIPSPLLSVNLWRICLDEAQMVEGSTSKTTAMALRLKATHRWCVTGTPMNKGLEDLFGLFAFLELEPINIEFWWNTFISKSFYEKDNTETLFEMFGQLVWRTCKSDVLHQLGIPSQTEILHWQTFSPLETHIYQRQFEICSEKIMEKVNDRKTWACYTENILNKKLTQLDRGALNGLLQPFLMLRQACVHPQMVKGNWIALNKGKGTLTMENLLDQLIKKSSVQCAEDNRAAVSALNAMAGLFIIRENYVEAAAKYREVLQREVKYRDKFKTDSLQMIHTLENLADMLDGNHAGVGFTVRDDSLRSEANELKQKYLESYAGEVETSRNVIAPVSSTIKKLEAKLTGRNESWWVGTLAHANLLNTNQSVVHRIKDELTAKASRKKQVGSIIYQFNDLNGLENVLIGKILGIESSRSSVLRSLDDLGKLDPQTLVEGAVTCHLRKGSQNSNYYNDDIGGYKCTLCSYHDQFLRYESELFAEDKTDAIKRTGRNYQKFKLGGRNVDQLTEEQLDMVLLQEQEELAESIEHASLKGILRHGTWGPSETERTLKIIHGISKLYGLSQQVVEDGANHLKLFEAAKKEFKLNRILWRKIYDQVSALDELEQATTRLRLATPADKRAHSSHNEQTPSTSTASTSTSTNRRKTKVPVSLQNQLGYTQESDEKIQTIHILKAHEIEPKMHQSQMEFAGSDHQLTVHLGQVMYLETLKKSGYGKKGTTNSDDCPVCTSPLGYEWCVLICGHSFCSECVKKMCPNPAHSLQCPICRITMKYADISFVDTKVEESTEGASQDVEPQPSTSKGIPTVSSFAHIPLSRELVGSHSSKIGQIVEVLIKLETARPGEKVIIFSAWVEVLDIISRALDQNDIKYCLLKAGDKFQKTLEAFKTQPHIQVLLMPMSSGSKGLNIIEATHVFLVEPTLNLANELQAIGRVHRIGQTKPTFVHRFYVKNTIEEQLYDIVKTQDVSSDDEGSLTVADLKKLVSRRR